MSVSLKLSSILSNDAPFKEGEVVWPIVTGAVLLLLGFILVSASHFEYGLFEGENYGKSKFISYSEEALESIKVNKPKDRRFVFKNVDRQSEELTLILRVGLGPGHLNRPLSDLLVRVLLVTVVGFLYTIILTIRFVRSGSVSDTQKMTVVGAFYAGLILAGVMSASILLRLHDEYITFAG